MHSVLNRNQTDRIPVDSERNSLRDDLYAIMQDYRQDYRDETPFRNQTPRARVESFQDSSPDGEEGNRPRVQSLYIDTDVDIDENNYDFDLLSGKINTFFILKKTTIF